VIRTFKFPLEPNRRQTGLLAEWLERCRVLYNVALEQRREWWRMGGKSLSLFRQQKELTELRASDPQYGRIPVLVCRSPLRQLDRAFQAFFRRAKRGETAGYPRFKGRHRLDSFEIGRAPVEGKKVRIPIMGLVKFRKYRDLKGTIRDVRIGLRAGKWYVAFSCDLGEAPVKKPASRPVGVDVGLSSFATLSDGKKVENPRFFRKGEDLLARRQRALSRKKRGSKNRLQAKRLVQKAHEHVRNQRLDFVRKQAVELYRTHDCIVYEDLNLKGLAQSKLAKSVLDAAWGMFIRALNDKAEGAGRWAIAVDPRGTSVRCSSCEKPVPKSLSERTHRCEKCGLVLDRDENAARNILALGRSAAGVFSQSPSD
jgi:putative transposase